MDQEVRELVEIKTNLFDCDKYPHHALRFNIDLLLVKMCLERVQVSTFDQLSHQIAAIFQEIAGMKAKLTRIYLQKEK